MSSSPLGKMIRARRKSLDLTIDDLAAKVGVDRSYIGKIENEGILPLPKVLTKIVSSLNDKPDKYIRLYKSLKFKKAINSMKQKMNPENF